MKKFKIDANDLTVENVTKFVEDFKNGALPLHLKSQEPFANEGPLTEVAGTTFDELVLDESKDVLVKYYAPWCGHCKKLAPTWDKLAEDYKDITDLTIAKYDKTVNEAEKEWAVKSFPTMIFYPKNNKEGVKYEGDRDLEAFKKFLEENSSVL
jgi:protein disulfide isomerase